MILLLGNWISTTFGNEINGRSLISFLWCIKKLNNKTLKYIKEYFSEEIHDQLIKGIEILDNEFEKSKETILYDNYGIENENDNENKENHQIHGNIKGNEFSENDRNDLSKEISLKRSFININEANINEAKENTEIKLLKNEYTLEVNNNKRNKNDNVNGINDEKQFLMKRNIDTKHIEISSNEKENENNVNNKIVNINDDNQTKANNKNKEIFSDKNEKSNKNILMKNLMEIDEQYSMLPEETSISGTINNRVEKSFVTHKTIQLSGIIDNTVSFSEKEKSFSKSKKMDSDIEVTINYMNEGVINSNNTKIKENSNEQKCDDEIKKSNIMLNQKTNENENNNNKRSIIELENPINKNEVNKKLNRIDSKIELVNNENPKNEIKSETLIESNNFKKEVNSNVEEKVNVKMKSIEINDNVKIKEESFMESNPSKKIKINNDISKSVILIENSDLIFEKENPRRKLHFKHKENNSIIVIDDDTKSNINKTEKIKNVIYIDSSYSNNDLKIENKDIPNINNKNVFTVTADKNALVIDNDQDQKTPKNDFETNLDDNEKENNDNFDNINDNTVNMELSNKEDEKIHVKMKESMNEKINEKMNENIDENMNINVDEKINEKIHEKIDKKMNEKVDENMNNHEISMELENNRNLGKYMNS